MTDGVAGSLAIPLDGLSVAVTRPQHQAQDLARRIAELGGRVIAFPLLTIAPATDPAALRTSIDRLAGIDLAVFISPNAVNFGMVAIREAGGLPSGVGIAAVGQGSARALRELGVTDVIAPTERFDSEGLLALPELQQIVGWRVLIFRGDGGRELLGDTLRERGAEVEYVACYQRGKAERSAAELLTASPDALTVTSSEALGHLWQLADGAVRERLAALPLFVQHPRIAAAAQEQGWSEVHLCTSGDDGLLAGLVAWAAQRKSP